MSTVATISLAVIAATCVISMAAFVVFVLVSWRLVRQVQTILTLVERALPGLISGARGILTRVDQEIVGDAIRTFHRVSTVVDSGVDTVEQVQSTARRVARVVILPQVATAAGLVAAIREGLGWLRPGGDGKRP
jgi:hypothetical protein